MERLVWILVDVYLEFTKRRLLVLVAEMDWNWNCNDVYSARITLCNDTIPVTSTLSSLL